MNTNDNLIVLLSYADTVEKQKQLSECLESAKATGCKIVLVSHFRDSLEFQTKADVYLFEEDNPVLKKDRYEEFSITNFNWYESSDFRAVWTTPQTHDYAVFKLMQHGYSVAKSLGKKNVFFVNYDCVIDLAKFERCYVDPLSGSDVCYASNRKCLPSNFMSVCMLSCRVGVLDDLFASIHSMSDFYTNRADGWQIERLFRRYLDDKKSKLHGNDYPEELTDRISVPRVSGFWSSKPIDVVPLVDRSGNCYVFLRGINSGSHAVKIMSGRINTELELTPSSVKLIPLGNLESTAVSVYYEGERCYQFEFSESRWKFYAYNSVRFKNDPIYRYVEEAKSQGAVQHIPELESLAYILQEHHVKNFMEIGTEQGGTFCLQCRLSDPDGIKISLDLPSPTINVTERNKVLNALPGRIHLLNMDSHSEQARQAVASILQNQKLDYLFIDGDHSFNGVKRDFEMYSEFVREGGLIAFHDTASHIVWLACDVFEFWNSLQGDKRDITVGSSWGGIGVVVKNSKLRYVPRKLSYPIKVSYNFIRGAHLELISDVPAKYKFCVLDSRNDHVVTQAILPGNHWVKTSTTHYVPYRLQISNLNEKVMCFTHDFNCKGKRVFVNLDSTALGDTVSWFPYVDEFRKKHGCEMVCSTFWNDLFKPMYPEITFVSPGSTVDNLYAQFPVGFWGEYPADLPRPVNLSRFSSDILGLDYQEIRPRVYIKNTKRLLSDKYVCIATWSTFSAKLWHSEGGWQTVVDYLNSKGYKVVLIQTEPNIFKLGSVLMPSIEKEDIQVTLQWLFNAEFFIGLTSGLSWLAWSLNKPVAWISGFDLEGAEPKDKVWRVVNKDVCYGCASDPKLKLDQGDWNWCPRQKGTERQFECTKKISPSQVISAVDSVMKTLAQSDTVRTKSET